VAILAAVEVPSSPEILVQTLQRVVQSQAAPAVRAMAEDVIYLVSKPKGTLCNNSYCQTSNKTLLNTFVQLYQGMLTSAENAYRGLQTMSLNYQQNNLPAVAESLLLKRKCNGLKCNEQKCSKISGHVDPSITTFLAVSEVPSAFQGREWNEDVQLRAPTSTVIWTTCVQRHSISTRRSGIS